MLQQTQVETVLPYYTRFLERFPTLEALARSSEEEILALWSGLGYYSRARNLRRAAQRVAAEHGGRIPDDFDSLIQLPGVGRYMAGAIMSIAFNEPFPIVDGNVRRVLSRLNGWTEPGDAQLWEAAERIARDGNPRTVNQAMMELGATVCTFRTPRCEQCPLKPTCIARGTGQQANMPAPRKRRQTVRVDLYAVVDSNRNGFLMREDASMWEFPLLTDPPGTGFRKIGAYASPSRSRGLDSNRNGFALQPAELPESPVRRCPGNLSDAENPLVCWRSPESEEIWTIAACHIFWSLKGLGCRGGL